jgi:DNA-directed RNA polymerase specialized sigma24 family protein
VNESQPEPPDADLIAAMGYQDDDIEAAKNAFRIFFNRHCDYLLHHLRRVNSRLTGRGLDVDDVVQEVFAKVWRRGHQTFRIVKHSEGICPVASTRAWLTTIAMRVVLNMLRRPDRVDPIDPQDNEDLFADPNSENKIRHAVVVQQMVQRTLSETDAAIVWFKMEYYDPVSGQSTPPRDELNAFLAEHELSDSAFRKRYSRAIDALQSAGTPTTTITA